MLTHVSPEAVRHIDHEQRQIRRIGDACGRKVHEVFEAPVLFGIAEVKLDLEPQALVVHKRRIGQGQVTAAQDDMGAGLGAQVCFRDDDDMQRLGKLFVEQLPLIHAGLDVPLHSGLCAVLLWEVVVIDLGAIFAMRTVPGIGTDVGEVQCRIAPQLGNQVQTALSRHMEGVVIAKVAIQHQGGQRTYLHDQAQQGINHGFDPHQFWGERDVCLGCVRATGRTPWTTFGAWPERFFRVGFGLAGGLLRVAAHDLLHADWARVPLRDTDQGQREKGQPRHRLAIRLAKNRSRP